ncbi:MAG: M48 family metalloprotease [Gammaproteobacteria bacterium]|nr:M48 family metalloprotease [Gammaproteobacteria bacterium]NNM14459.1 M48 family metalloprotease [Gammaproteobacteria bacterium]
MHKPAIWTRLHYALLLLPLLFLLGCATNPVTGKKELRVVGEDTEINLGIQQYNPARQSQGGDYVIDPQLTKYVQGVGNRLAKVSDRPLPYEFQVINSSVPNAWALPGGKIAINRGLLYELNSEAELAAVMGHEIVHSAARHGAKSMERGMLMQLGMIAVQAKTYDHKYANMINASTQLAAGLLSQKYGRNAELESDYYGMQYMHKAGYDPNAAIDLQETFVRISEEAGRGNPGWLEGLFSSHPPSQIRVEKNKETAAALGSSGEYGRESYRAATSRIMRTKPAYEQYDEAVKAYKNKDFRNAQALASQALQIEPREGNFHALLGEIELQSNRPRAALPHIRKALNANPNFFMYHLQNGVALYDTNKLNESYSAFERSLKLLPTATAHSAMGKIAEQSGRQDLAVKHYEAAAQSNTQAGQASAFRLAEIQLPRNPGKYILTQAQADSSGKVYLLVKNQAPFAVGNVQIVSGIIDPRTRRALQTAPVNINQAIPAGQTIRVPVNLGPVTTQAQLQAIQSKVQKAQAAR